MSKKPTEGFVSKYLGNLEEQQESEKADLSKDTVNCNWIADMVREWIGDDNIVQILPVTDNGKDIGFCVYYPFIPTGGEGKGHDSVYIRCVYVLPKYRRMGHGERAVRELAQKFSGHDICFSLHDKYTPTAMFAKTVMQRLDMECVACKTEFAGTKYYIFRNPSKTA